MKIISNSVPMVTMGGVSIPLSSVVLLTAQNSASSHFDTFRRASVAYQVPVGFKLVIVAIKIVANTASAIQISMGYGDTAVSDSATGPTNQVGFNFGGYAPIAGSTAASAGSTFEVPVRLEVPSGKYVYSLNGGGTGSGGTVIIGYLA